MVQCQEVTVGRFFELTGASVEPKTETSKNQHVQNWRSSRVLTRTNLAKLPLQAVLIWLRFTHSHIVLIASHCKLCQGQDRQGGTKNGIKSLAVRGNEERDSRFCAFSSAPAKSNPYLDADSHTHTSTRLAESRTTAEVS